MTPKKKKETIVIEQIEKWLQINLLIHYNIRYPDVSLDSRSYWLLRLFIGLVITDILSL